jgi:hypothetical protein
MRDKTNRKPKQSANQHPQKPAPKMPPVPAKAQNAEKHDAVISTSANQKRGDKERKNMDKRWITDSIIAGATVGILVVGIFQWCAIRGQWKEMQSSSKDTHELATAAVASNRAWIAPQQMVLGSSVESGLPLKYQIRIVNPGKEPALGVVWNIKTFGVPYVSESETANSVQMGPNGTCVGLEPGPKDGMVLYPAGPTNFWLPLSIPNTPENLILIEDVKRRVKSLFIDGCFVYMATDGKHTSAFRYFLRDIPGQSFVTDKNRNQVAAWNFNAALNGNAAN